MKIERRRESCLRSASGSESDGYGRRECVIDGENGFNLARMLGERHLCGKRLSLHACVGALGMYYFDKARQGNITMKPAISSLLVFCNRMHVVFILFA